MIIIQRNAEGHEELLQNLEKEVKNKWRWEWLQTVVTIKDPAKEYPKLKWTGGSVTMVVKDHVRKIVPGGVWCTLCEKGQQYSDKGLGNIRQHLRTFRHVKNIASSIDKQQLLPGASMPEAANMMYGVPAVYDTALATTTETTPKIMPQVHILDRVANMEAMVVAFIAEHNLSFSVSEGLIQLAKELSKDTNALKRLNMHRTTASYKLTLKHLGSIDVPSCTSEKLYVATVNLFQNHEIPWKNLLAMLSDSASTMRGKIAGLETEVWDNVAEHLLDESCHHIHNIVKKITSVFDYFLENLLRDVSNEFKFCADNLAISEEITFHLGIKYRKPISYHQCRWLSVFDTSVAFEGASDSYKVFFPLLKVRLEL